MVDIWLIHSEQSRLDKANASENANVPHLLSVTIPKSEKSKQDDTYKKDARLFFLKPAWRESVSALSVMPVDKAPLK